MKPPFCSKLRLLAVATAVAIAAGTEPVAAQSTGTIQGEVREAGSLRPLSTIQIFIPAAGRGTLSSASGRFQLVNVPAGQVQVTAQGVGYGSVTQTVTVTPGEVVQVNFNLAPSAIALDEVVVTGAGQATQVKKLGNTVATINTRDLETAPVTSMSEVLQGREPGVVAVPTGGVAGEGSKIRIRGTSSLSQSNQPIIYVDGVRVDNKGGMGGVEQGGGSPSRLDDINPAAIERIEILKGAAAATLYGTEASNGVIQIFTKAGAAGTPRWSLQMEQGFSNYPLERYKPHTGFARTQEQATAVAQHFGLGSLSPYEVFEVDLWPDLVETGTMGNYSLSVNGGNERVTYFVSGRVLGEDGPFRSDGFGPAQPGMEYVTDINQKRQANANLTFSPWDNLRIRANSMYVDGHQQTPDNNNNIYGTVSTLVNSKPERFHPERNPTGSNFTSIREPMYRTTSQDVQRFAGSIGASYTPMESLNLDLTLGVDVASEQNVRHIPFGWNVDGVSNATPQGSRTVRNRDNRQYTIDAKASWNEDFTPRVTSAFVVGGQAFFENSMRAGGTGTRFSGPGLEVINAGGDQSVFEQRIEQVSGGVYAQEQIGLDDWVFLTLGARYDKHSAFGETAGGALYPKVSVSIVPTDMPGWHENATLSSARVRAAVGTSGLQPGAFDKFTTFEPVNSATGPGVAPLNLGNPDLKPEVSLEFEGGADLGLFNDRISVTTTYWNRTVDDLLVARQFAYSGGFRFPQLDNIGQMKAWGLEMGVSGMVFNNPTASLDLFANAAYLRERVTDMGGSPPIKPGYVRYRNTIKEGYAPGSFFGPKLVDGEFPIDTNADGQPDTREQLLAYLAQPLNDSNRDLHTLRGVLAPAEDGTLLGHYLGKPTPDWTGSFGGTLNFLQNFSLATLFEYKAGNYSVHNLTDAFRRSHVSIGRNIREASEIEAILKNPASTPEQRLDAARIWVTEVQALTPYDGLGEIESADHIRWREVSLSYRVPGSLIERFGMNNLELTLAGRNLALWTKYSGVDPDLNVVGGWDPGNAQEFNNFVTGVEGWGFAMPRRISLSASIGF